MTSRLTVLGSCGAWPRLASRAAAAAAFSGEILLASEGFEVPLG